jgi:hypothetical protein
MFRFIALLVAATIVNAAAPVRKWHAAKVVSVKSRSIFRVYEIIDSYDPRCTLESREFRNPFKPLDVSDGARVQIAEGNGPVMYLIDNAGRTHKATLILQSLMPAPPAPPHNEPE